MKIEADLDEAVAYALAMLRELVVEWLREAVAKSGMSAAEVGRRLGDYGLSLNRSAMSSAMNGKRQLLATEMLAISKITGHALPAPIQNREDRQFSPEIFQMFLARLCQESGMPATEAANLAAAVLKVAHRLEEHRGDADFHKSVERQAETLGLILFPEKQRTQPPKS